MKYNLFSRLDDVADLEIWDPENSNDRNWNEVDLYHKAKRSKDALEDSRKARENGVPTINSPEGSFIVMNRWATLLNLDLIGIDIPEYDYGEPQNISMETPYVEKPAIEIGPGRHDVRFCGLEDEELPFNNEPLESDYPRVFEEFIEADRHIKAYRIGNEVRAVELDDRSKWDGEEIQVDQKLDKMLNSIGSYFGLRILEADILETGGALYCVDVNQTANLSGVSDAVEIYMDEIMRVLEQSGPEVYTGLESTSLPLKSD